MANSSAIKGYAAGILAAGLYGTNPLFAVPLYGMGMHAEQVLFWRYLTAIPIMALMMISRNESLRIATVRQGMLLAAAGILVGISSATLFMAYNYMDVGIASTLLFLYPVMVALIMTVCYREKITKLTALCLAGTLAGIALLGKTSAGVPLSLAGMLLVGASSLSYALYIVGANRTALRDISPMKVIFYVLAFGITVFAIPMAVKGTFEIPTGTIGWLNVLGLALFPTALSFWLTTVSIQHIGPTRAAILGAFEPITGVLISVCVFGGILSPREVSGVILVLLSVTVLTSGPLLRHYLSAVRHRMHPRA